MQEISDKSLHPFEDRESQQKSLTILLVSDIHDDHKKLEKLKAWFGEKFKERCHYIFALGDFDNIKNNNPSPNAEINQYEKVSNILSFLEFASVPIYYIPGNHDAAGFFKETPTLTQHSKCIHKASVKIADGLQIVGLGGSGPAYLEKSGKNELYWEGYPYTTDNDFSEDLKAVLEKFCNENTQTILFTHWGPYLSSTTVDTVDHPELPVFSGSKVLSQALREKHWNILCNLHGHTHAGVGRTNSGQVQIINPGSLHWGDFGILYLERSNVTNKWVIKKTEFINLNAY
jgi:Predicted phosphoesterases, related to the Icc protein